MKRPKLYILAFILVIAALTFWKFDQPPKTTYVTAEAKIGDIEVSVLSSGKLEPFKSVNVGARTTGQIKKLYVGIGDKVQQGALIAEIDSVVQENALRDAEASLKSVRAQRDRTMAMQDQYSRAYDRQKLLFQSKGVSRESLESAEAAFKANEADLLEVEANVERNAVLVDKAKLDLAYAKITAPIDGVVIAVIAKEGQTVNAALQTPTIVKIAQLETMTVRVKISEADVTKVSVGQEAEFTILGERSRKYRATLRAIEPVPYDYNDDSSSTNAGSSTAIYYSGIFDVDNADGTLKVSMTAEVNIILLRKPNIVTIPSIAVSRDIQDKPQVQVLDKAGKVELRNIVVGLDNKEIAEVVSGISPGDMVVLGQSSDEAKAGFPPGPPPTSL